MVIDQSARRPRKEEQMQHIQEQVKARLVKPPFLKVFSNPKQ